jgi:hypothetical protein
MQIPADRAFRMFEKYRRSRKHLEFAGYLLGCKHACWARVTYVWPETCTIAIKLFKGEEDKSWECFVPLHEATFWSSEEQDAHFPGQLWVKEGDSVLRMSFPDGTTIALTERGTPGAAGTAPAP